MLGAIIGDIIGSVYERDNVKTTHFYLFTPSSRFTDDTVMTLAIAKWLTDCPNHSFKELVTTMQTLGRNYLNVGYGGRFLHWLTDLNPQPYGSFGNGSVEPL